MKFIKMNQLSKGGLGTYHPLATRNRFGISLHNKNKILRKSIDYHNENIPKIIMPKEPTMKTLNDSISQTTQHLKQELILRKKSQ